MTMLPLKEYQKESLDVLAEYCAETLRRALANEHRPERAAFEIVTGRDYYAPDQFENVPYICLRVPTGGGKTLIAAHAVGTIARHLAHNDRPLALWVTPTTTIRDQTLKGLQDRTHPYYAALRESLNRSFQVLTIEEAQQASRAMMSSDAIVIVTTIQSYRIENERGEEDKANRRIYDDNGYLMDHFRNLPEWMRQRLEKSDGEVRLSLANVMKLRGPVVIMDEAHNARTKTSFESLVRFGPLAVLELTATPKQEHDPAKGEFASNVLHAVSAIQLHKEGMIKLPVELESREEWLQVLEATIQKRNELAQFAAGFESKTGRHIRPIALIQAQNQSKKRETHTYGKVEEALTKRFGIDEDRVCVATGDVKGLEGIDLADPNCKIEYVITVDALREGWDCSFAYVLGSIGNVATETAVEQLLGRVLRMPQAKPTGVPELDRAYAIVQSENVLQTASKLRDSLVKRCGFDADTVKDAFRVTRMTDTGRLLPVAAIPLQESPRLAELPDSIRLKVEFDKGNNVLHVHERLSREEVQAIRDVAQTLVDRHAVEEHWRRDRPVGTADKKLDEYAEPLNVPQLCVRDGERVVLFEPIELDEFEWNLDACSHTLSEEDFDLTWKAGDRVSIEMTEKGGTKIGAMAPVLVTQLALIDEGEDWSEVELIRWMNAELHKGGKLMGLTAAHTQAWLHRALRHLRDDRDADLGILVRKRHTLADVLIRRVAEHGRNQVRRVAELLIQGVAKTRLETSPEQAFHLREDEYGPYREYHGAYTFERHAFDKIGDMRLTERDGEEAECAKRIDSHDNVKRWLRNLEHESAGGFSLPLSPGRFFPDFIVELNDGRIALVEYKGGDRANDPRELHKKAVGELWEACSDDKCVFLWVVDKDWGELDKKLSPVA